MPSARHGIRTAGAYALTLLLLAGAPAGAGEYTGDPVAGSFVYPVGDESDFAKAAPGDGAGFYVSDPYLARRGKRKRRIHYGVDLANGRGGAEVRSIAAGVVVVSDANALVKVRKKQRLKLPTLVNGKRVYRWSTRYRTTYAWRTGWGNRVVIRHTLPKGDVVYSLYAHLKPKSVIVKRGEVVAAGQPIARVGKTGRASSAHLHLEIRQAFRENEEAEEPVEVGMETAEVDIDASGDRTASVAPDRGGSKDERVGGNEPGGVARIGESRASALESKTMDPMAFLERHVVRFKDLDPKSWESRYALAACRDGLIAGDGSHFEPSEPITREQFYAALVAAFHLETPFTKPGFESSRDALVDSGILDPHSGRRERPDDSVTRSDALELMLRCLDGRAARGRSLARLDAMQVGRDFNRTFAGPDAAAAAEREARTIAASETEARRKAAREKAAIAAKRAKAKGSRPKTRVAAVKPVVPQPRLDPGFESLAKSDRKLTRAETCLLFASALRMSGNQRSALERAAVRTANEG